MLDVAIIGAGAAGLGAAKTAISKGLSFKVLEAASFIGGRARTDTSSLGIPYDFGCRTLYGGSDNPFLAYAKETGARLGLPPGKSIYHDGSRFLDAEETAVVDTDFERFTAALRTAYEHASNVPGTADKSQGDILSAHDTCAAYLPMSDHPSMADAADVSVADPAHMALAIVGPEAVDGYGALILGAAADVSVTLDCPVTAIDLSGRHVALDTAMGRIEARTIVVTVSTAVLAAERIALLPDGWPDEKVAAIEAVPLASTTKVGLRLTPGALPPEIATVQDGTVMGSYVPCASYAPENIFWIFGVGNGDLATAYIGGQFSRDLAFAGEGAQTAWALESFRTLFGGSMQNSVMATCATPYDREPWIGGGISYCRFGTGNQRPALAEPIDDRVFFAGEACSPNYPGTAHGAWLSGSAAIERIASPESWSAT